jgi:hypothetical protein
VISGRGVQRPGFRFKSLNKRVRAARPKPASQFNEMNQEIWDTYRYTNPRNVTKIFFTSTAVEANFLQKMVKRMTLEKPDKCRKEMLVCLPLGVERRGRRKGVGV